MIVCLVSYYIWCKFIITFTVGITFGVIFLITSTVDITFDVYVNTIVVVITFDVFIICTVATTFDGMHYIWCWNTSVNIGGLRSECYAPVPLCWNLNP